MAKTPTKQRVFLHKNKELLDLPNLIKIQTDSYKWFIDEGLKEIFEELSPIEDFTGKKYALSLKEYHFEQPKLTKVQAKNKNLTFEASLKVAAELINKETGEVKTQEIFLGDYPVMTNRGTFIINGVERVVVSQLVRSPGVFFTRDNNASYFGAKVIPNRGAWLEIETSQNGVMSVKIDRKRKIALTARLRAF